MAGIPSGVAGTLIMTAGGFKAIDKINVGDMVLSKHESTGELAFKAVLRTTVRPKSELVAFKVDGSWIRCSQGHPMWVSGQGWTKAKDLKSGMVLHTSQGIASIRPFRFCRPNLPHSELDGNQ